MHAHTGTNRKRQKKKGQRHKDNLQGRQQDRWKLTSSRIEFHAAAGAGRPPIPWRGSQQRRPSSEGIRSSQPPAKNPETERARNFPRRGEGGRGRQRVLLSIPRRRLLPRRAVPANYTLDVATTAGNRVRAGEASLPLGVSAEPGSKITQLSGWGLCKSWL